jgi:hypothetical protein
LEACACPFSPAASIVNDSTQTLKVETRLPNGALVEGAACVLINDYGSIAAKSGSPHSVRRSSKDLDISCTQPDQPPANARAISRANAGMAGNIIFGGGIGALIDHNKGTAYTYPTWIQLVFGQTLVFDRRDEKDGSPVPGVTPQVAASTANKTPSQGMPGSSNACMQGMPPCPALR